MSKVAMWRFLFQNFLKSTKFVLFKFHEKAVYFSQLFLFLYAVYDANELLCEEINWNCGFLMRHLQHYLQFVSNMVENIKVLVILIGCLNNCTWKIYLQCDAHCSSVGSAFFCRLPHPFQLVPFCLHFFGRHKSLSEWVTMETL